MFIKICGITNQPDALLAIALGADALGFVFAPSPRQVSVARVSQLLPQLPPEVLTFGVFRDELPQRIVAILAETGLRGAQIHGWLSDEGLEVVRAHTPWVIRAANAYMPGFDRVIHQPAWALLVDGEHSGSGRVFDWSLLDGISPARRLIVAGGLTPNNVARAIEQVRPFGVDVASGVEARPGRKDPVLLRAFIEAARRAANVVGDANEEDP